MPGSSVEVASDDVKSDDVESVEELLPIALLTVSLVMDKTRTELRHATKM